MSEDKSSQLHNALPAEETIYIGLLRKAFNLSTNDFLFDDGFISASSRAEIHSKASLYAVFDSLDEVVKDVGMMKYEAYGKLEGYLDDRYDRFLEAAKLFKRELLSGNDRDKIIADLASLRVSHLFDLLPVNKKAAVIYLYDKGYRFQYDVPGLTKLKYEKIIGE